MSWSRIIFGLILVAGVMVLSGCCVNRCGGLVTDPILEGTCGCEGPCTGDCGSAAAETCGDGCDSCGPPCGGLFSPLKYFMGCGAGCGEIYVDEWLSDPPECCDPCDNCGNFVGAVDSCRWHCFPLHRRNLWGTRHTAAHSPSHGEQWHDGEVIVDETWSDEMAAPEVPEDEEEVAEPELEDDKPQKSDAPKAARSKSVLRGRPTTPR